MPKRSPAQTSETPTRAARGSKATARSTRNGSHTGERASTADLGMQLRASAENELRLQRELASAKRLIRKHEKTIRERNEEIAEIRAALTDAHNAPDYDHADDIVEIFTFWQKECGHLKTRMTSDRVTKIRARLREGYTKDELKQAINGAARNPWKIDGRVYDDIASIFKSGRAVDDMKARGELARPVTHVASCFSCSRSFDVDAEKARGRTSVATCGKCYDAAQEKVA
jgi:ATP-dependent exoDNAse (exonuclease V) alpha subunit